MKKTTDSSTLHNSLVTSSQENLQENKGGANSMPTQAPMESHKSVIVQSSPDEFSASQVLFFNLKKYITNKIYRFYKKYIQKKKIYSGKEGKYDYTLLMLEKRKEEIKSIINALDGKTLDEIAKENNVSYSFIDLRSGSLDASGVIIYQLESKEYHIFIHEGDSENRKRFTFAHELGHFFLHKYKLEKKTDDDPYNAIIDKKENFLYRVDTPSRTDKEEIEANYFAAELLMPETLVKKIRETTKNITDLAHIFSVSEQSIGYRLINLGLFKE